jgi:hypothetical protein
MSFEVDSWVWMADEEEEYLPAQVSKSSFKAGEDGIVKTEDGEVRYRASIRAIEHHAQCIHHRFLYRLTSSKEPRPRK